MHNSTTAQVQDPFVRTGKDMEDSITLTSAT